MILGTNFSSESGPEIPLNVSLLIRFGGHVTETRKREPPGFLLTKKGATCSRSPPVLVPTESPKRFPNRTFPRLCRRSPSVLLPVQRLPQPPTPSPTPGAGCCSQATPTKARPG